MDDYWLFSLETGFEDFAINLLGIKFYLYYFFIGSEQDLDELILALPAGSSFKIRWNGLHVIRISRRNSIVAV